MLAKVTLIGNLGADPELRFVDGKDGEQRAVCNFRIASNIGWGENKATVWYRCTVWGPQAENCNKFLRRGSMVYVEGEPVFDKETGAPKLFTDKDGNVRASFEVTARQVLFLTRMAEDGDSAEDSDDLPV